MYSSNVVSFLDVTPKNLLVFKHSCFRDMSQNAGRASALQAAKECMNPRSQSVMGPHPRENSGPTGRSYSMAPLQTTATQVH